MSQMQICVEREAVMNVDPELQTIRRAIDALDEAMADLLACRICLSHQAQSIKSRAGFPVRDESREEEIRYRYDLRWRGASVVARAILDWCRDD
jgi:chorismate mutase